MKHKWLVALLCAAAAALIAAHLRVPHGIQTWRMVESAAGKRSGERMACIMPNGDVDVNRADAAQLQALEGVGPALASEIIAERESNGAYAYPEDLLNVKGIGAKTLQKMWQQLKLP